MTLERWKKSDENVNQHMLIRETRDSGSAQMVEHLSNKHQTLSLNPSTTRKKTRVVVFISCKQYFKTRKFTTKTEGLQDGMQEVPKGNK
jgi:uncharacterized Rossmann fold enzyme